MNENTIWLNIGVNEIREEMVKKGVEISHYHVRRLLKMCGFKKRSFRKNIPMKSVEGRNE